MNKTLHRNNIKDRAPVFGKVVDAKRQGVFGEFIYSKKCKCCKGLFTSYGFYPAAKGTRSKDGLRAICRKCWDVLYTGDYLTVEERNKRIAAVYETQQNQTTLDEFLL